MISESVIIFGETGNIVMVVDGALPKDAPIMFRFNDTDHDLEILSNNEVIYIERGLNAELCQRIKKRNEIGMMEIIDPNNPPEYLTNVAYQRV